MYLSHSAMCTDYHSSRSVITVIYKYSILCTCNNWVTPQFVGSAYTSHSVLIYHYCPGSRVGVDSCQFEQICKRSHCGHCCGSFVKVSVFAELSAGAQKSQGQRWRSKPNVNRSGFRVIWSDAAEVWFSDANQVDLLLAFWPLKAVALF